MYSLLISTISNRKVATLLDFRTVGCHHLDQATREECVEIFCEEYVVFKRTAIAFESGQRDEVVDLSTAGPDSEEAASSHREGAESLTVFTGQEGEREYGNLTFSQEGWDNDGDDEEEEEEEEVLTDDDIRKEAKKVLKNFRKFVQKFDFSQVYPEFKTGQQLHLFYDLMPLNPGPIYEWMKEKDPQMVRFGLIPLMAQGSLGFLGALSAQAFCERMNSCAKDVMTDAHTLMDPVELEMAVCLRMNRKFMEYMRANYKHISGQPFGVTTVISDDDMVNISSSDDVSSSNAGEQTSAAAPASSSSSATVTW